MTCKNATSPAMIPILTQLLSAGSTLVEHVILLHCVSPSALSISERLCFLPYSAKIDPVWLDLKLQLYLILTSGPGNSPGKKSWISSG